MSGEPRPKQGLKPKKRYRGRARPDEPLADRCEASVCAGCTGRATERHHILRRSQGGTDDVSNTLDTCQNCHRFIHDHPVLARRYGLLAGMSG